MIAFYRKSRFLTEKNDESGGRPTGSIWCDANKRPSEITDHIIDGVGNVSSKKDDSGCEGHG